MLKSETSELLNWHLQKYKSVINLELNRFVMSELMDDYVDISMIVALLYEQMTKIKKWPIVIISYYLTNIVNEFLNV